MDELNRELQILSETPYGSVMKSSIYNSANLLLKIINDTIKNNEKNLRDLGLQTSNISYNNTLATDLLFEIDYINNTIQAQYNDVKKINSQLIMQYGVDEMSGRPIAYIWDEWNSRSLIN